MMRRRAVARKYDEYDGQESIVANKKLQVNHYFQANRCIRHF
jgi:hypothetical protein